MRTRLLAILTSAVMTSMLVNFVHESDAHPQAPDAHPQASNAHPQASDTPVDRKQSPATATVLNEQLDVQWVGQEDRYAWYRAERRGGATEIVVIDMLSGRRLDAKDFPAAVPQISSDEAATALELDAMTEIERSQNGGGETEIEFICSLQMGSSSMSYLKI